ncbi:MAG: ATP-binding protein [Thermodesulfobacteriota bacterium]|nr:ATP-binding protein [Thermodesulfobacteriota bacterium]
MNNFINRNSELSQLKTLYQKQSGQLVILYGRRRLGKTTLLREFCGDKSHCYYMADKAGEQSQKKSLALAMATALQEPLLQSAEYPEWYDLFAAFDRFRPKNTKIVLILDEYQYICQTQPAFSSFIQKWWDEHWQHEEVMLILCGSVTSMMYRETMAQSAPLYGRASAQILLTPLRYNHLKDFFPGRIEEELIKLYSLGGGVPRYLELLQSYQNFTEALQELVLNRSGLLYHEARYLLHEEISSPNTCWSILQVLGGGTGRISEIGSKLGLPANQLTHYIELLRDLYLVYREVPVLEKNPARSKKGFYQVADPFLRLWFGSIYPYDSFLEFGQAALIMERLNPLIQNHIAFCYEQLCRDFVKNNFAVFGCLKVGRQWARNYEIDVAGVNTDFRLNIVGECKWSHKKVGLSVFRKLQNKIKDNKLPLAPDCQFLLFSKAGFTKDLGRAAERDKNLLLISSLFESGGQPLLSLK